MAKEGALMYLPEGDQANQAVQAALDRLTQSLDARKNRLFDPTLLSMAEGFLTPTKTGGFGESLGIAAGKVRQSEEQEAKREQELAQAQLGIAQKGLELQKQQRLADFYRGRMGAPQAEQAAPSGAPSGAPSEAATSNIISDPTYGTGYRLGPPRPDPRRDMLMAAAMSSKDPFEVEKALSEAEGRRYKTTEAGTWDLVQNVFFPTPTGKTIDVIFQGSSYPVPESLAIQANIFRGQGRHKEANSLLSGYISGAQVPSSRESAARQAGATKRAEVREGQAPITIVYGDKEYAVPPSVAQDFYSAPTPREARQVLEAHFARISGAEPSAPAAAPRLEEAPRAEAPRAEAPEAPRPEVSRAGPASAGEIAAKAEAEKVFARKRAELAAEAESNIPKTLEVAEETKALVNRVLRNVDESGNFVGLLSRPGLGPAVLKILSEGIQGPQGSYRIGAVEEAALRLSGASKKDIENIEKLRADFSQAELAFTQLYMAKQGAITEGERRIVRNLGGSTEMSASAIRTRMALIKERADFDKQTINAYSDWKKGHPDKSFKDYQETNAYRRSLADYGVKTANIADSLDKKPEKIWRYNPKTGTLE